MSQQIQRFSLKEKSMKDDFDAAALVRSVSATGENELLEYRNQTQQLTEQTAQDLKRNVYRNYTLFIETAKEISVLEGEMYQLQQMLNDQKQILRQLTACSVTSENFERPVVKHKEKEVVPQDSRQSLAFLLEKVEGCAHVTEVPGRQLVHSGDLVELEPDSYTAVRRMHAFLLTDSLLLALWLPARKGPIKYRFDALYELDSLATVNVRDTGNTQNAFKILMFPDAKMYQTETPKAKRQWLDIIEDSKKKKSTAESCRQELASLSTSDGRMSPETPLSASNPFADDFETVAATTKSPLDEDWIKEVPEDLDVFIAIREFEEAVDLVEKTNAYLATHAPCAELREFSARVEQRVRALTQALMGELSLSPERTLRGGPRASRFAVRQLVRLGKTAKACELFLHSHSAVMKYSLRQLRIEGATSLYVRRLCSVFFARLQSTAREFNDAFPEEQLCSSALAVWGRKELHTFVATFKLQVFASKAPLPIVADCIRTARDHCDQLNEDGFELRFEFDWLISEHVLQLLQDAQTANNEAIRQRAQEDQWRPINTEGLKALNELLDKTRAKNLPDLSSRVYDECWIRLSMATWQFAAHFLDSVAACIQLYSPDVHTALSTFVQDLCKTQVRYMEKSLYDKRFQSKSSFIIDNAEYLLKEVLPVASGMWKEKVAEPCHGLNQLSRELQRLHKVRDTVVGQKV